MSERHKYMTVSIPVGITDEVKHLIEQRRYWPSVSSFVREATLEKIKVEGRLLRELRETEKDPIKGADLPHAGNSLKKKM
jgi:Arc/MetJ-type ribon-helix-helix transcriptional regulator